MAFAYNQENGGKYFQMNATGHVTEKLTWDFFSIFCSCMSLKHNIRIEVKFGMFAFRNERTGVVKTMLN